MEKSDEMEFAVGTPTELQERFGIDWDTWTPPELDLDAIPAELHDIVPWVLRFGVSCDVRRHRVAEKTSPEDIQALDDVISPRHQQIEDYVNDHDADESTSEEQYAFGRLLIFHCEECNGQGIKAPLETSIRKYQEEPSLKRRRRLQSHYESTANFVGERRGDGWYAHLESNLIAAEVLLGIKG